MRLRFWREDPVQFLGEVADLVPVYAAADIFILPTIYDPFRMPASKRWLAGYQ